jgi:catechol 2,3-dioxygenase-like lactoylglutathione lyase family enzyme
MKIDHINIVVKDLKKAADFFKDLGFVTVKEGSLEGEWINKVTGLNGVKAEYVKVAYPGDSTTIELLKYHSPEGTTDPEIGKPNQIGYRHMAIEVKNIQEKVKELKQKGIECISEIQNYGQGKKLCYFYGPEGILLELAEYVK